MKLKVVRKGGSGSGHYGHRGRPGLVGGGLPEGSTASDYAASVEDDSSYSAFGGVLDEFVDGMNEERESLGEGRLSVHSSVNGGRSKRYITTIPKETTYSMLERVGFEPLYSNNKTHWKHESGYRASVGGSSGKYSGAYYIDISYDKRSHAIAGRNNAFGG